MQEFGDLQSATTCTTEGCCLFSRQPSTLGREHRRGRGCCQPLTALLSIAIVFSALYILAIAPIYFFFFPLSPSPCCGFSNFVTHIRKLQQGVYRYFLLFLYSIPVQLIASLTRIFRLYANLFYIYN